MHQVRKKLRINIPAGVDTGTRLRVSGEGNAGRKMPAVTLGAVVDPLLVEEGAARDRRDAVIALLPVHCEMFVS